LRWIKAVRVTVAVLAVDTADSVGQLGVTQQP
jgi:hypothetical protein